ncbi:hypothetical protein ACINK0_15880 [Deinococcus sp. VB343]|uniref:hypothetical protein n=1 Tax=Deinococcus sp. VB343 TaxID=3385567 RepID=UPI0039C94384
MSRRQRATARDVHEAYMPHVPFEFYTNMVLGKDAPESPAEDERVAERIRREAELYQAGLEARGREVKMTPEEATAIGAAILR